MSWLPPPRALSRLWNSADACLQAKSDSFGDASAWFKNLALPGYQAPCLNYLTSGNRRAEWVQCTSTLTNRLESIMWVTDPDIYLFSTLLKIVIYLFIFHLQNLSPHLSELNISVKYPRAFSHPHALSRLLSASIGAASSSSGNALLSQTSLPGKAFCLYRSHTFSTTLPLQPRPGPLASWTLVGRFSKQKYRMPS